jgi:hypothetical protein
MVKVATGDAARAVEGAATHAPAHTTTKPAIDASDIINLLIFFTDAPAFACS